MKRVPTPETAAPRRRFQRRRIRFSVLVRTEDGRTATGTASDLSLGGLRLASADRLTVGDKGTAQITIGQGETVRAPAEVVWQHGVNGAAKTYGIRFQNLDGHDRFTILEAIYAPGSGIQFARDRGTGDRPAAEPVAPVPAT